MFSVKNHEKTRSGTKSGSDGARKGERKTMPPRGRENSLPARRRVRSTKKGEPPLLFFEFSGITRYLLLFPQCGHGNDGIILRICKLSVHRELRILFLGFRTERCAIFSVPDALLRSPALFADEISYSARSELILVLCTILAKAPISKAER